MTKYNELIQLASLFEHKIGAEVRFKEDIARKLFESIQDVKDLIDSAKRRAEIAFRENNRSFENAERNQIHALQKLEGNLKLALEMLVKY